MCLLYNAARRDVMQRETKRCDGDYRDGEGGCDGDHELISDKPLWFVLTLERKEVRYAVV